MLEGCLIALKLLGVIAAAVFTVLGTTHEFKDKKKKLTKWGKAAIGGTMLSALLAFGATLIENDIKQAESRAAAAKSQESSQRIEAVLHELNRTLQPISSVSLTLLDVGIPMNEPDFADYLKYVSTGIDKYLAAPDRDLNVIDGIHESATDMIDGKPQAKHLQIGTGTAYFPSEILHPMAGLVLRIDSAQLSFFKKPIDPKKFNDAQSEADLIVPLTISTYLNLEKDVVENRFFLSGRMNSVQPDPWTSRGGLVSIPDLANSQVFLSLGPNYEDQTYGHSKTGATFIIKGQQVASLRSKFTMGVAALGLGNRSQWIAATSWHRHTSDDGLPLWEYRFGPEPIDDRDRPKPSGNGGKWTLLRLDPDPKRMQPPSAPSR